MEKKTSFAIFALVFLVFAYLLADHMGKINFSWGNVPQKNEIYLLEWGLSENGMGRFSAYSTNPRECTLCGKPAFLIPGENVVLYDYSMCRGNVELVCGNLNLSFQNIAYPSSAVSANFETSYFGGELSVGMSGSGYSGGYRALEFYLDDEKVMAPAVLLNGTFNFTEKLEAGSGKHELKVFLSGKELYRTEFEVPGKPFPFELFLIILFSLGISSFVYPPKSESGMFVACLGVLLAFGLIYQFALSNNLGLPGWLVPGIYAGALLILWESQKKL